MNSPNRINQNRSPFASVRRFEQFVERGGNRTWFTPFRFGEDQLQRSAHQLLIG